MSADQLYKDGDIVWIKLRNNYWWPGEVSEGLRQQFKHVKKKPYCVVKFFNEDTFEYVHSEKRVLPFQCSKKQEFIDLGLALHNAKYEFMDKFPADVKFAERLTQTTFISNRPGSIIKAVLTQPLMPIDTCSSPNDGDSDVDRPSTSATATKRLEVRQMTTKRRTQSISTIKILDISTNRNASATSDVPTTSSAAATLSVANNNSNDSNLYRCGMCDFTSVRQNVIVLHRKSHGRIEKTNNAPPVTPSPSRKSSLTAPADAAVPPVESTIEASPSDVTASERLLNGAAEATTDTTAPTTPAITTEPQPTATTSNNTPAKVTPARRGRGARNRNVQLLRTSTRNLRSSTTGQFYHSPGANAELPTVSSAAINASVASVADDWTHDDDSSQQSAARANLSIQATTATTSTSSNSTTPAISPLTADQGEVEGTEPQQSAETIRQMIAADWSDYEDDAEGNAVAASVEGVESMTADTSQTASSCSTLTDTRTTTNENTTSSVTADTTASTTSTPTSTASPSGARAGFCRNIPKKDRRDIVMKDFSSSSNSGTSNAPASSKSSGPTTGTGNSNSNISSSFASVDTPPLIVIPDSSASSDTSYDSVVLVENNTQITPARQIDSITLAQDNSTAASTHTTISCFDFEEDEEENDGDLLTSIANFKKKYYSPDKLTLTPATTNNGHGERAADNGVTASAMQIVNRNDEQLSDEIDKLLQQTKTSRVVTSNDASKELLPIKERGKRIFKSRNRSLIDEQSQAHAHAHELLSTTKVTTPAEIRRKLKDAHNALAEHSKRINTSLEQPPDNKASENGTQPEENTALAQHVTSDDAIESTQSAVVVVPTDESSTSEAGAEFGSPASMLDEDRMPTATTTQYLSQLDELPEMNAAAQDNFQPLNSSSQADEIVADITPAQLQPEVKTPNKKSKKLKLKMKKKKLQMKRAKQNLLHDVITLQVDERENNAALSAINVHKYAKPPEAQELDRAADKTKQKNNVTMAQAKGSSKANDATQLESQKKRATSPPQKRTSEENEQQPHNEKRSMQENEVNNINRKMQDKTASEETQKIDVGEINAEEKNGSKIVGELEPEPEPEPVVINVEKPNANIAVNDDRVQHQPTVKKPKHKLLINSLKEKPGETLNLQHTQQAPEAAADNDNHATARRRRPHIKITATRQQQSEEAQQQRQQSEREHDTAQHDKGIHEELPLPTPERAEKTHIAIDETSSKPETHKLELQKLKLEEVADLAKRIETGPIELNANVIAMEAVITESNDKAAELAIISNTTTTQTTLSVTNDSAGLPAEESIAAPAGHTATAISTPVPAASETKPSLTESVSKSETERAMVVRTSSKIIEDHVPLICAEPDEQMNERSSAKQKLTNNTATNKRDATEINAEECVSELKEKASLKMQKSDDTNHVDAEEQINEHHYTQQQKQDNLESYNETAKALQKVETTEQIVAADDETKLDEKSEPEATQQRAPEELEKVDLKTMECAEQRQQDESPHLKTGEKKDKDELEIKPTNEQTQSPATNTDNDGTKTLMEDTPHIMKSEQKINEDVPAATDEENLVERDEQLKKHINKEDEQESSKTEQAEVLDNLPKKKEAAELENVREENSMKEEEQSQSAAEFLEENEALKETTKATEQNVENVNYESAEKFESKLDIKEQEQTPPALTNNLVKQIESEVQQVPSENVSMEVTRNELKARRHTKEQDNNLEINPAQIGRKSSAAKANEPIISDRDINSTENVTVITKKEVPKAELAAENATHINATAGGTQLPDTTTTVTPAPPAQIEKVRITVDVSNPLSSQIENILGANKLPLTTSNSKSAEVLAAAGASKFKNKMDTEILSETEQNSDAIVTQIQNLCPQMKVTRKERIIEPAPQSNTQTASATNQTLQSVSTAPRKSANERPIILQQQIIQTPLHEPLIDGSQHGHGGGTFSNSKPVVKRQHERQPLDEHEQPPKQQTKYELTEYQKQLQAQQQKLYKQQQQTFQQHLKHQQQITQSSATATATAAQPLTHVKKQMGVDARGNKYVIIKNTPAEAAASTSLSKVASKSLTTNMTSTPEQKCTVTSSTEAEQQQITPPLKSPPAMGNSNRKASSHTPANSSTQLNRSLSSTSSTSSSCSSSAKSSLSLAASHRREQRQLKQMARQSQDNTLHHHNVNNMSAASSTFDGRTSPLPAKIPRSSSSVSGILTDDDVHVAQQQYLQLQQQRMQKQKKHSTSASPTGAHNADSDPPPLHHLHNRKPRKQPQQHRPSSSGGSLHKKHSTSTQNSNDTQRDEAPAICPQRQMQQQQQQQQNTLIQHGVAAASSPTPAPPPATSPTIPNAAPTTVMEQQLIPVQTEEVDDSPKILAVPTQPIPGYNDTFLLCTLVNNNYKPIDNTPLYLDHESNQLVPVPLEALEGPPCLIVGQPSSDETTTTNNANSAATQRDHRQPAQMDQHQEIPAKHHSIDTTNSSTASPAAATVTASNELICLQPTLVEDEHEQQHHLITELDSSLIEEDPIEAHVENVEDMESDKHAYLPQDDPIDMGADNAVILNIEGQQIILDAATFAHLLAHPETNTQLITEDGTEFVLTREVLLALQAQQLEAQQQQQLQAQAQELAAGAGTPAEILAVALSGTELYAGGVLQIETTDGSIVFPVPAELTEAATTPNLKHAVTSETNAVLNQTPIMSTLETPSTTTICGSANTESAAIGVVTADSNTTSGNLLQEVRTGGITHSRLTLDDSLAVIGVTAQNSILPPSLELPITVTNPNIAPPAKAAPLTPTRSGLTGGITGAVDAVSGEVHLFTNVAGS